MNTRSSKEVTQMLKNWSNGDESALSELIEIVYEELRKLAAFYLRNQQPNSTLQPTMLVHEAYVRLIDVGQGDVQWQNRAHFFGIAAHLMRCILVDHIRTHYAAKRGAGKQNLSLAEAQNIFKDQDVDLLALDDALTSLAAIDERQCKIVELRFFSGLSVEETAEALGISPATVHRDWNIARAFLRREISRQDK
jgi:RNA polymerase sigma factor (TIGR02999 family)